MRPGLELGFSPGVCAGDGADVSTDHPLLWTRENKMDSSVAR